MPATALRHFDEDISRVRALISHAEALSGAQEAERLRSDVLRSAWMFAVGALDAYFSDAYTDVVAATVISKSRHSQIDLPDFFYGIKVPVRAVLESYPTNTNWRWRMAARRMMERENVLRLATIQSLFNKFFREGHRLFGNVLDSWITHLDANKRLFGITQARYNEMTRAERQNAHKIAKSKWKNDSKRFFSGGMTASTIVTAPRFHLSGLSWVVRF